MQLSSKTKGGNLPRLRGGGSRLHRRHSRLSRAVLDRLGITPAESSAPPARFDAGPLDAQTGGRVANAISQRDWLRRSARKTGLGRAVCPGGRNGRVKRVGWLLTREGEEDDAREILEVHVTSELADLLASPRATSRR